MSTVVCNCKILPLPCISSHCGFSNTGKGQTKSSAAVNQIGERKDGVAQLIITAMTSFHQLRCDCCKGAHDANGFWAREPEFQPPHIWKAVQKYNLKHGVKPKRPPSEKNTNAERSAVWCTSAATNNVWSTI